MRAEELNHLEPGRWLRLTVEQTENMTAQLDQLAARYADRAEVEFYTAPGCVCLAHFRVRQTAPRGTGRAILADLFELADRLNVSVILFAVPERRKTFRAPMSQTALIEWYHKNGFVHRRGMLKSCLIREPQP